MINFRHVNHLAKWLKDRLFTTLAVGFWFFFSHFEDSLGKVYGNTEVYGCASRLRETALSDRCWHTSQKCLVRCLLHMYEAHRGPTCCCCCSKVMLGLLRFIVVSG